MPHGDHGDRHQQQPVFPGNNSHAYDLYSQGLSAIYKFYDRIHDPDYALGEDSAIWEKVWRDAKIAQAMTQRLHSVAGNDWHIEPGGKSENDKILAELTQEAFETHICDFNEGRCNLATAILRGRSWAFIRNRRMWARLGESPPMRWWLPIGLEDGDKRRFQTVPTKVIDQFGIERQTVQGEIWSVMREVWEPLRHPELFVRVVYRDQEGRLGYGRGLLESIYFLFWAKSIVWREGLQGLERWAQGIVVGKVGRDMVGSVNKSAEKARDDLLEVLHKMRSRHVIVMGKDDEIKVETSGGQGHQMVISFLEYIDNSLLGVITGSVLPFGGNSSSGSLARAKVEEDTSETLFQFDRTKIDEAITRSVIAMFIQMNTRNLASIGLLGAKTPRFKTVQQKREDHETNATVIATVHGAGIKLKLDEVYKKIGFTPPAEGDEVLEGGSEPSGGGGFPPGVGMPSFPFEAKVGA